MSTANQTPYPELYSLFETHLHGDWESLYPTWQAAVEAYVQYNPGSGETLRKELMKLAGAMTSEQAWTLIDSWPNSFPVKYFEVEFRDFAEQAIGIIDRVAATRGE